MSYILSFKPAPYMGTHDPSATIVREGEIVAAAEEERFIRDKQAIRVFPTRAINYCLKEAGVDIEDTEIAIPYNPAKYDKKRKSDILTGSLKTKIINTGGLILEDKRASVTKSISAELHKHFNHIPDKFHFYDHHLCHAASAFYPSGFEDGVIITIDGTGEYDSTVIWDVDNRGSLTRLQTEPTRNSLGFFYGIVTEYLGYRVRNGAGKVMGLAPYGEQNTELRRKLYDMVSLTEEGYDVSELAGIVAESNYAEAVDYFEEKIGHPRRHVGEDFTETHKDIARLTQEFTEDAAVNVVKNATHQTGKHNVCLSGGVALNCKMNKKIREQAFVENLFIQPVSGDAGLSMGAALEHAKSLGHDVCFEMTHPYLGPDYSNERIKETLEKVKVPHEKVEEPSKLAAKHIANGALIGWFQGRLEMGPRALGHRSILADPRAIDSKDRVNYYVKHRENWRPFAPSILADQAQDYLKDSTSSPFMVDTFEPKDEKKEEMRAVLHPADKTTRPQTVTREDAPKYYKLIDEFRELTGVPLVLNTSFNDSGEPIVNTPRDAIKDFFGMGLDVLFLNDYVIYKPNTEL